MPNFPTMSRREQSRQICRALSQPKTVTIISSRPLPWPPSALYPNLAGFPSNEVQTERYRASRLRSAGSLIRRKKCGGALPCCAYASLVTRSRSSSKAAAGTVADSVLFRVLARSGFAVNGLLHILIGVIAISVAVVGGGAQADQSGALGQLARNPAGVILLWVIVVGLVALGLWQVVQTILVPGPDPKREWLHRIGDLGKAVIYIAVAFTAFIFAHGGTTSSSQSSKTFSAKLLSAPGGVVVLVIVGLGVVAIGGFFVFLGLSRHFTRGIRVPPAPVGTAVVALGITGYIAKGVAVAVVGILFVVAAVTLDPSTGSGLDGALKTLAALPFGQIILVLVGIGLIAYGIYCGARALLARL